MKILTKHYRKNILAQIRTLDVDHIINNDGLNEKIK